MTNTIKHRSCLDKTDKLNNRLENLEWIRIEHSLVSSTPAKRSSPEEDISCVDIPDIDDKKEQGVICK